MAIAQNKVATPKRILAIKFSSIGDIVLTTSPIKSLKSIFPSAKIDFLTREDFAPLVEGNKYLNTIIPFNREANLFQLVKTGKWINNTDYDLIIDFHNSLRSRIILSQIRRTPKRILKKPRWKRFLLFRFRKNTFPQDFNQLNLLHEPIKDLIKNNDLPSTELFVSDEEKEQSSKYLKDHGIIKQFIVIVPGAAWPQKVWSANYYVELIDKIKLVKKYDFVILGGKDDKICTDIANLNGNINNLQGITNLRETLAIITNSQFVIGADTGFVHAAEALGRNTVMILGPTTKESGAGKNRDSSIIIENNEIWCRPCSQNGKRKCYRDEQFCMTTITAEYVFNKMKGLLS